MSSRNGIDERFDDLVRELRSEHVTASPELRERVRAIAAEAPAPRAPFAERFRLRRAALVLVPACVVAAVSAAMLHGLTSSGTKSTSDQTLTLAARANDAPPHKAVGGAIPRLSGSFAYKRRLGTSESAAALPPSGRLQDYRVTMRVRVSGLDALSRSVVKAMRVARLLGGYVANVEYSSPSVRHGDAVLLLRIPIANVQKAVADYAGLGTLVSQHFTVIDVQKQYDAEVERVGKLRFQIARLQAQIDSGSLGDVEKAHAQEQLEYARLTLHRILVQKRTTLNHARLSTVRLSFTTFHKKQKQVVPAVPSKLDRTLGDAGRVLGHEAVWALYALVVAGPFAFLFLLMLGAGRSRRRRVERRLLASTR
jgi:hypothetical protein